MFTSEGLGPTRSFLPCNFPASINGNLELRPSLPTQKYILSRITTLASSHCIFLSLTYSSHSIGYSACLKHGDWAILSRTTRSLSVTRDGLLRRSRRRIRWRAVLQLELELELELELVGLWSTVRRLRREGGVLHRRRSRRLLRRCWKVRVTGRRRWRSRLSSKRRCRLLHLRLHLSRRRLYLSLQKSRRSMPRPRPLHRLRLLQKSSPALHQTSPPPTLSHRLERRRMTSSMILCPWTTRCGYDRRMICSGMILHRSLSLW